jgi:hypothetical protein
MRGGYEFSIHSQLALWDPQRVELTELAVAKLRESSTVMLNAAAEGEYPEFGLSVVRKVVLKNINVSLNH